MAKDTGKCGNCDCAAGTCAKENGGKCGNACDCAAGTCVKENGGKCGANCDCAAGTCAKEY
ncbi:hypothetical protein M758_8G127800 [Ceratodon purpureus]|uniref:Uncharacterized protein n=2 Tax=Ceratodon purpureus TaxID=3225 RepID=A0A8T0GY31_CERPU|nr:hypothetical protein KC19_N010000 [Ceratodon purpureus]KAG0564691.1 hypothetical protein KC19_8G131400 [Ceratodon purpureus]KAG0608729.1 hypothetical protein M758_8G127800 [Ceratodon purpureus]